MSSPNKGADAWFFKMRGNAALTAAEKEQFHAVDRIRETRRTLQAAARHPPRDASRRPEPPPPLRPAMAASTWQAPGWLDAGSDQAARCVTPPSPSPAADGAKGELAVTHFPGDVGGDLANVNRWRAASRPAAGRRRPASPPLVTKVTAGPKTISLIDVTGPQTRLAAGWTRHGADTWFFKFTGPDALVGAEKAKFTAFLESVRFTKPE